jgi:dephospho-CoA kinase
MHSAFDVLVVMAVPDRVQVERLMRDRGMSEEEIRARMQAQAPLEDKAAVADILLDNEGAPEDLERQVDRIWDDLVARAVV